MLGFKLCFCSYSLTRKNVVTRHWSAQCLRCALFLLTRKNVVARWSNGDVQSEGKVGISLSSDSPLVAKKLSTSFLSSRAWSAVVIDDD